MNPTTRAAQEVHDLLQQIKDRGDFALQNGAIGAPCTEEQIAGYTDTLPASLLDFYRVMNGCCFEAAYKFNEDVRVELMIPTIENVGSFFSGDETYTFAPGVQFLTAEDAAADALTFFVIEVGKSLQDAYVVCAWTRHEHEPSFRFDDFGGFLRKVIALNGAPWWFEEEAKSVSRSMKRILSKPPKKVKPFLVGDRVEGVDKQGKGIVRQVVKTSDYPELADFVTSYDRFEQRDELLLVSFDVCNQTLWIPADSISRLPKKKQLVDRIRLDPLKFIAYLDGVDQEEVSLLLADCYWGSYFGAMSSVAPYRHRMYETTEGPYVLLRAWRYYAVFAHISTEEFAQRVVSWLDYLVPLIRLDLFHECPFRATRGKYRMKEYSFSWKPVAVIHALLDCLLIHLNERQSSEKGFMLHDDLLQSLQSIGDKMKETPPNLDDDNWQYRYQDKYPNVLEQIDHSIYRITTHPGGDERVSVFQGITHDLPAELVEAGIDASYKTTVRVWKDPYRKLDEDR